MGRAIVRFLGQLWLQLNMIQDERTMGVKVKSELSAQIEVAELVVLGIGSQ